MIVPDFDGVCRVLIHAVQHDAPRAILLIVFLIVLFCMRAARLCEDQNQLNFGRFAAGAKKSTRNVPLFWLPLHFAATGAVELRARAVGRR